MVEPSLIRDDQIARAMLDLRALGVTVCEWGEADGYPEGTSFVFLWRNEETMEVFADNDGRAIKEVFQDGRFINPIGYREDVHQVLARYELVTDWANKGQVVVYRDKSAPGFNHSLEAKRNSSGRR